jgi:glutathione peroxidase
VHEKSIPASCKEFTPKLANFATNIKDMKSLFSLLLGWIFTQSNVQVEAPKSFYDFKMKTIDGKIFDFSGLKGKRVLIVNTASRCGFTSQYKKLENLYQTYGRENFIILGFPANNFGAQEPGTNADIEDFCNKTYQISFPVFEKISVKGEDIHPLYQWLTQKKYNGVSDTSVSWNFQKFMIDEHGSWTGTVSPVRSPDCDRIVNWITKKQ